MNLQKEKKDLEELHEQGCHDMSENELGTELHMHIITVNFPATQAKVGVSPLCPFMSPFITIGNISPVGLWESPYP